MTPDALTLLPEFESPAWRRVSAKPLGLGESPYWCDASQSLLCVDIAGHAAVRLNPATGELQTWGLPQTPGCMAPLSGGGYVLGLRDGVYTSTDWQGELRPVWHFEPTATGLRLNDGKADATGRFWVGSYSERREATAALFVLQPLGHSWQVAAQRSGFAASNGLAMNDQLHYWADTAGHQVLRLSTDLAQAERFAQFAKKPADWAHSQDPDHLRYAGRPDGATLDAEGNYWVAMFEGSAVLQINALGQVLRRLRTPVLRPTMACLGGPSGNTLFITSAQAPANSAEAAAQPDSGHVFSVQVATKACPVHAVKPL